MTHFMLNAQASGPGLAALRPTSLQPQLLSHLGFTDELQIHATPPIPSASTGLPVNDVIDTSSSHSPTAAVLDALHHMTAFQGCTEQGFG